MAKQLGPCAAFATCEISASFVPLLQATQILILKSVGNAMGKEDKMVCPHCGNKMKINRKGDLECVACKYVILTVKK